MLKKFGIGDCIVVMGLAPLILCTCGDHRARDFVVVKIHEDYRNKFDNKEFALSDFEWENADAFIYDDISEEWRDYYTNNLIPIPMTIMLRLKVAGIEHVQEAIDHLSTLPFIEQAEIGFEYWKWGDGWTGQ